jgi:hypothetical protein
VYCIPDGVEYATSTIYLSITRQIVTQNARLTFGFFDGATRFDCIQEAKKLTDLPAFQIVVAEAGRLIRFASAGHSLRMGEILDQFDAAASETSIVPWTQITPWSNRVCSVCLHADVSVEASCRHDFCTHCVADQTACPLCRAPIACNERK